MRFQELPLTHGASLDLCFVVIGRRSFNISCSHLYQSSTIKSTLLMQYGRKGCWRMNSLISFQLAFLYGNIPKSSFCLGDGEEICTGRMSNETLA